jgi:lysozyme
MYRHTHKDPVIDLCDDLIASTEGCELKAYYCPGGKLTIGYGHTGPDVYEGMKVTKEQANELLFKDICRFKNGVEKLLKRAAQPHETAAFTSFAFNIGLGAFARSTALRCFNSGEYGTYDRAALQASNLEDLSGVMWGFAAFRMVNGQISKGLVKRRAYEAELFATGGWHRATSDRMPQVIDDPEPKPRILRPGMTGELVSQLHDALEEVGHPCYAGNAYTFVTAAQVKAFQAKHGLKADGIYGPATCEKLTEALGD